MNSKDTGNLDNGFDLDEILAEVKAFKKPNEKTTGPDVESKNWTSQDVDRLINAAGLPSKDYETESEQADYSIYLNYDPKDASSIVTETKQPLSERPKASNILEMRLPDRILDRTLNREAQPEEIVIDPEVEPDNDESVKYTAAEINMSSSSLPSNFDMGIAPLDSNEYLRGMETDEVRERFLKILELEKTAEHDVFGINDPIEKPGVILEKNWFSKTSDLEPMPVVIPAEDALRASAAEGKTIVNGTQPFPGIDLKETNGGVDGQIILTGFENSEPKIESVSEAAVETALYARRKEKAKSFTLGDIPEDGENSYPSASGSETVDSGNENEEENDIQTRPKNKRLEYLFPEQRNRVYSSIKTAYSRSTLSSAVLLFIVLAYLILLALPIINTAFSIDSALFSANGKAYLILNFLLLIVAAIANMPCMMSGYKSLFKLKPNCDTAVVLAVSFAVIQNLIVFFAPQPAVNVYTVFCAAAVFGLMLNTFGRRFGHAGTMGNFEFCAFNSAQSLYSIKEIENSAEAFEIGRGVLMGNPAVAYSSKTEFPSEFIENARNVGIAEVFSGYQVPIASGVSLIIGIISGVISKNFLQGFSAFTGALCLSVPASALLVSNFSLRAANKKLNASNAMISNWSAAEECAKSNAVVIDSADLFDRSLCEMHGMKDFKNFRIDDVILYTAAMIIKSGGPLADIFDKVIVCNRELLPPVKSLSFEDRLGLTAWIHGQKVFLGNRNMLVHHNIDVPPKGDEDKYKHDGRKVMYLAIANKIAAMFVVSYSADPALIPYIKILANNGIQLLVRTCDSNITEDLLADCFDLPVNNVKVISSIAGRIFKRYKDKITETAPARVLHDGSAVSLLMSISSAGSLSFGVRIAQIIQTVSIGLGLIGLLVLVSLSKADMAGSLQIILFQSFWVFVALAAAFFKRLK
ncbi:MAG: hypothetical protein WCN92_07130 [Eubacteriales bacterium]